MDDKMICLWREAFKISNSSSGVVIEPRRSSRHPEVRIRDLAYADDIALLNSSLQLAENLLHCVEKSASLVGLYLNAPKTEILTSNINNDYDIKTLNGEILKHVNNFKYLGAHVPSSNHDFNIRGNWLGLPNPTGQCLRHGQTGKVQTHVPIQKE